MPTGKVKAEPELVRFDGMNGNMERAPTCYEADEEGHNLITDRRESEL